MEMLSHSGRATVEGPEVPDAPASFPMEFRVRLRGVTGKKLSGGKLVDTADNMFKLGIRRDYPFSKPLLVWQTDISHPNISHPSEGGVVCMRLLQEWRAERTLLSIVEGVAELLEHPNAAEPLNFPSCIAAVEHAAQG